MAGRAGPIAIAQSNEQQCRSGRRGQTRLGYAPAGRDMPVRARSATRPAARQCPRPVARICGGEVSWPPSLKCGRRDALFRLDVRRLDDRPPFLDLGLLIGTKRLRRLPLALRNFKALFGEALTYSRIA